MTPDSIDPSDKPASTVVLRFDADKDDLHQQLEAEAHLVQAIPRNGEVVAIENQYHAVTDVVHNYDANGIEVHLGPSAESVEDARKKAELESKSGSGD